MKEHDKNIKGFDRLNDLLLVNFSDGSEVIIPLKQLSTGLVS